MDCLSRGLFEPRGSAGDNGNQFFLVSVCSHLQPQPPTLEVTHTSSASSPSKWYQELQTVSTEGLLGSSLVWVPSAPVGIGAWR